MSTSSKVSVSLPHGLLEAVREVYPDTGMSQLVREALQCLLDRDGYDMYYVPERWEIVKV